jgi:hypothetical protein
MEARYESERVYISAYSVRPLDIILRYSATHSARAMSSDWPSQQ